MSFSATDAAFEGFRLTRRAPMAIIWWAVAYLVVMAAVFAGAGTTIGNLMAVTEQLEGVTNPTLEDFRPFLQAYGAIMAWALPLTLVFSAVINAAVVRAVLRPAEKAFGYLRLGADELRVLAVSVVLGILFAVVAGVIWTLVAVIAGVAVASEAPALWLVVILLGIVAFCLIIWLAVRFSLAIPITIGERRIAIFDSFRVTKGRFWGLFGMAVIAVVMSLIVGLLVGLLGQVAFIFTGSITSLADMDGQDPMTVLQSMWPALLAWGVVNAVVSALQLAIMYAPFAAAYRDLTNRA